MQTYNVLGVRIAAVQIDPLIRQMQEWIRLRKMSNILIFANVHVVTEALHDEQFRNILNESICLPDGKPLSWVGRALGYHLPRRVYGPDLLIDFCKATAIDGCRHFFYGAAPGVAERLAVKLQNQFPGTVVVGCYSPPFRQLTLEEDTHIVDMINDAHPDVLWVGLGCPKQEKWAYEHRGRLRVPILAAVGQAFDIHAGSARQAPRWMREHGLEWLFRFAHEPRRLWRRYLVYNSQFLYFLLLETLGLRRFEPGNLQAFRNE
jgi:N-acetylglucosaminyldiphosphoundecaprenol N-acetyl-beta-D-mannosaminyltransferase